MRAVVDIGSNSVKYSVAETERGAIKNLHSRSWVTGLGRGLDAGGCLSRESLEKTESAFREMAQFFAPLPIKELQVIATAAVRECRNPETVEKLVHDIFGAKLKILTGLEEAQASMRGAQAAARLVWGEREAIFIDVGGASTEVGVLSPIFQGHSFYAGAVRCHEALGWGDAPVSDTAWGEATSQMEKFFPQLEWARLEQIWKKDNPPRAVVAVGGTLVMAASMCAERGASAHVFPDLGITVSATALEELNNELRKLSLAQRRQVPGIFPDRADIVCAGTLVLTTLLKKLGSPQVLVTNWGLRHGFLLPPDANDH